MKKIVNVIMAVIVVIGLLPFLDIASKMQWTVYLGMPLIILIGSAGVAFITKRIEAIIGGMIIAALFPVILGTVNSLLSAI